MPADSGVACLPALIYAFYAVYLIGVTYMEHS